MKYEFFATSSSSLDVYIVIVSNDSGSLIMTCNCPAGSKGILCRHRKALITGKSVVYSLPQEGIIPKSYKKL